MDGDDLFADIFNDSPAPAPGPAPAPAVATPAAPAPAPARAPAPTPNPAPGPSAAAGHARPTPLPAPAPAPAPIPSPIHSAASATGRTPAVSPSSIPANRHGSHALASQPAPSSVPSAAVSRVPAPAQAYHARGAHRQQPQYQQQQRQQQHQQHQQHQQQQQQQQGMQQGAVGAGTRAGADAAPHHASTVLIPASGGGGGVGGASAPAAGAGARHPASTSDTASADARICLRSLLKSEKDYTIRLAEVAMQYIRVKKPTIVGQIAAIIAHSKTLPPAEGRERRATMLLSALGPQIFISMYKKYVAHDPYLVRHLVLHGYECQERGKCGHSKNCETVHSVQDHLRNCPDSSKCKVDHCNAVRSAKLHFDSCRGCEDCTPALQAWMKCEHCRPKYNFEEEAKTIFQGFKTYDDQFATDSVRQKFPAIERLRPIVRQCKGEAEVALKNAAEKRHHTPAGRIDGYRSLVSLKERYKKIAAEVSRIVKSQPRPEPVATPPVPTADLVARASSAAESGRLDAGLLCGLDVRDQASASATIPELPSAGFETLKPQQLQVSIRSKLASQHCRLPEDAESVSKVIKFASDTLSNYLSLLAATISRVTSLRLASVEDISVHNESSLRAMLRLRHEDEYGTVPRMIRSPSEYIAQCRKDKPGRKRPRGRDETKESESLRGGLSTFKDAFRATIDEELAENTGKLTATDLNNTVHVFHQPHKPVWRLTADDVLNALPLVPQLEGRRVVQILTFQIKFRQLR